MGGLGNLLGRRLETERLEQAWERARDGVPQLVVVSGRRRVGKTFLLSHFVADKRSIFYGATQQAEAIELSRLIEAVARDLGPQAVDSTGGQFRNWEAALRFMAAEATDAPLIVVLDEVPYLTRSTPGFPSIVQAVWDHLATGTRLMLVLTGSAVSVIDRMLGAQGALRGRPTEALRIDPLDLLGARSFLPTLSPPEFIEAYAACGGYPLHLKKWNPEIGTEQNLLRLAGRTGGILIEDAVGILREELPETGGYARILGAIGRGRHRYSAIASEADQRIEHPLDLLVGAGFVRRSLPIGAPAGAKPIYEIGDPYLSFWYSLLYSDIPQIEAGQGRQVLERKRARWETHVGGVFEESARQHAQRLSAAGDLPDDLLIGRWWSTSGEQSEIDVLGLRGSQSHLLGEARWQERPMSLRDLRELKRKSARVPETTREPLYALWGRSGADSDVLDAGARGFSLLDILGE